MNSISVINGLCGCIIIPSQKQLKPAPTIPAPPHAGTRRIVHQASLKLKKIPYYYSPSPLSLLLLSLPTSTTTLLLRRLPSTSTSTSTNPGATTRPGPGNRGRRCPRPGRGGTSIVVQGDRGRGRIRQGGHLPAQRAQQLHQARDLGGLGGLVLEAHARVGVKGLEDQGGAWWFRRGVGGGGGGGVFLCFSYLGGFDVVFCGYAGLFGGGGL